MSYFSFLNKPINITSPFIIAEISCNHEGNLDEAKKLIQMARDAGADAAKIQHYYPEEMTFQSNNKEFTLTSGPWAGRSLFELYAKNALHFDQVRQLFEYAREINFPLFSSVFGEKSLSDLERVGCPAYKIASFECCDPVFIAKVAEKNKPMIISTGVSNNFEVQQAVHAAKNNIIGLMHCVSNYPTDPHKSNIQNISNLRWRYPHVRVGFSDHTATMHVAPLALALGACLFEVHLGNNSETSDDAAFSLNYHGFTSYIHNIREAAEILKPHYQPIIEQESYKYKRHMFASKIIDKGDELTLDNCVSMRGDGHISPVHFYMKEGETHASRDYNPGEPIGNNDDE